MLAGRLGAAGSATRDDRPVAHAVRADGSAVVQRPDGDGRTWRADRHRRPPTLKDVAAAAGVSYQTVSRVINRDARVRPGTRAAVEAAVEALGYAPSAAARALVTGRTRVLGVLVEDLAQFGPTGTLHGLEAAAGSSGWDLALTSVPADGVDAVPEALSTLRSRGAAALVLVCGSAAIMRTVRAQAFDLPLIGTSAAFEPDLPVTVGVDQRRGVRMAIEHLVALERRRIAHVAGPHGSVDAEIRLDEVRRALADRGLVPAAVAHGDWSARSGAEALADLPADVDGLLVSNDQMALGALAGLRARGRRVPEDVAVIGFDDVPEAAYYAPPLTTVRQDFVALGGRVVRLLDDALGPGDAERRIRVEPELVVRDSAPAPQRR